MSKEFEIEPDIPTGWRDPCSLVKRQTLRRRYMSDVIKKDRVPLGSIRDVFKDSEDTILSFLFRTELDQTRGNLGKSAFVRKPPEGVRIIPTSHDTVKVSFEPVDGAKVYKVQIKGSGERDELFEIAWKIKLSTQIHWNNVQRSTIKSLAKDPCQKINAVADSVKYEVWHEDEKRR